MTENTEQLRMTKLFAFFVPLGVSASLMTVSHVIINSTLARALQPEVVISSYAIAISLMSIMDRPLFLLRQTCSVMVEDRRSFRSMWGVSLLVISTIFVLNLLFAYSPIGHMILTYFFGVDHTLMQPTLDAYRILIFVCIFSGIRCLYQGVIIKQLRTKWITIGMGIRLVAMYALSVWFIKTEQVNSGQVGAIIFLSGMIIECLVALLEGHKLSRRLPHAIRHRPAVTKTHIFNFYRPILYSSFIALFIGPSINALLGRTDNMELSIASYAIAFSVTNLVLSFFSYTHQIVLHFHQLDRQVVIRFVWLLSFAPAILLAALCYTSAGIWFLQDVMGVSDRLMAECLNALRVFVIMAAVFPWLDYWNGRVMLSGKTRMMIWSQGGNLAVTFITLTICVVLSPGWNGAIGALAQSLGVIAEMSILLILLYATRKGLPAS